MITKLTLTIEEEVIDSAKDYTKSKGKSLSKIVENYLRLISSKEQKSEFILSPKLSKLLGVISLPEDFDYKSEMSKIIPDKYIK